MKRFNDGEKVKEIGFRQKLTVLHTFEDKLNGNVVRISAIENGIEYEWEIPERKLTEFNEIVDYSRINYKHKQECDKLPIPEKPTKEKFGWVDSIGFDGEPSGWQLEGGEEAYYKAVDEWCIYNINK